MIPVITLVGRPNVGKSTLFNRLTHTCDALVTNFPGLTRDRKYGYAEWKGHEFIVIDTGGIDNTEEGVKANIVYQSQVAIEEADIVLLIVDGHVGVMTADKSIANHLHKSKKNTVVVINKVDGIDINSVVGDFYSLGIKEIIFITALQGRGINNLLKQILSPIVNKNSVSVLLEEPFSKNNFSFPFNEETNLLKQGRNKLVYPQLLPIKCAIVGRPNVGKSTLTNCILGKERMIVCNVPGTTRDSIYIPMVRDKQNYVLIDTAGVRKRGNVKDTVEKFSIIKTLQAIKNANVVLLVIDANEGILDQDLSLLSFILNSGRSLVIAFNKWDSLSKEMRNTIEESLDQHFNFINFSRIHFISALHDTGIDNLFKSVNEAYQCATKRVNTALLTCIMRMAVDENQPPLVRGRRVKPKYAHAGGYNPLTIVIHGSQVKDLPDTYKRYLINYFRRSLKIIGTPIRIQFNEGPNPFSKSHNTLLNTQLCQKKRLVSYIKKNK